MIYDANITAGGEIIHFLVQRNGAGVIHEGYWQSGGSGWADYKEMAPNMITIDTPGAGTHKYHIRMWDGFSPATMYARGRILAWEML
jgi:hypothetical protein